MKHVLERGINNLKEVNKNFKKIKKVVDKAYKM